MEEILSGFLTLGILKNSFKGGKFTCNRFLTNAYLYIFLSLVLISISINLFNKYNIPSLMDVDNTLHFMGLLFLSIALMVTVMSWPVNNLFGKHFLWLLWIGVMGYTLYPLLQINPQLFSIVKFQALFVMTILTLFAFWKPHLISLSWGTSLFVLLIGLIVIQLFSLIIPGFYTSKIHYFISYISLILFAFFMLYDTKRLMTKARQCVRADYINDSMGIVLDGLNIFSDLFGIQNS